MGSLRGLRNKPECYYSDSPCEMRPCVHRESCEERFIETLEVYRKEIVAKGIERFKKRHRHQDAS